MQVIFAPDCREAFERAMPIFEAMGKSIRYMGPAGSGQHTKMANQIAIAGTLAGACEAVAYARAVGLDVEVELRLGGAGGWGVERDRRHD